MIPLNSLTPVFTTTTTTAAPYLSFKFNHHLPLIKLINHHNKKQHNQRTRVRRNGGICRAELAQDAPFAAAIGACILNSLVFPIPSGPDPEDGDSLIDSADARFAVMGILSFIPYFNWMSWVFAWLDTGKRWYAVYALVYLLPYLRSNLSLSPEESWLPISSIVLCIIHIQLEASIKNGDLQGFQLFNQFSGQLPRNKDFRISKERKKGNKNLPSSQDQSRNEIQGWGFPEKRSEDRERLKEDGEANEKEKH